MAVGRSAASKIDWTKISSSLGLKGQTAASLLAFKKRNDDARRKLNILSNAPQTVDFASYRSTLKNQAIIDEIEGHVKRFRPVTYDVGRQIRAISAFETEATKNAEETRDKVAVELQHLEATLKNIEEARPWEELTVDEVCAAAPEIDARTENMVSRGRWMPAGYKEKFGDLSFM